MSSLRVLILNQPFNKTTGGGITLSNLFAEWNKENLAVVCSAYLIDANLSTETCDNYYQIGDKERTWIFPFKYFRKNHSSGKLNFKVIENSKRQKSRLREKFIMDFLYPLLDYLGLSYFITKTTLSENLTKWMEDFGPDVIYAQAAFREDIHFCLAVQKNLGKPMVFHQMDDWPSRVAAKGLFKNFWKNVIDRELGFLIHKCNLLMSISDLMAEEYERRYNKKSIVFHNPIDLQFWQQYERNSFKLSEEPTILYAGRIGVGIDNSLEVVAKAIQIVNKQLNMKIQFILQSKDTPQWIKKYKNIQHRTLVSYQNLPRVFAEADLLVLPYDFSTSSISFIQYSMPTKASEYMACGTPIIVLAPKSTALAKYAKEQKWANVITEVNLEVISEEIRALIENEKYRKKLSVKAREVATLRHNSIIVRKGFKDALNKVSCTQSSK